MEVESGEGVRRCFPHFPLFFQVPFPYLLVFIYFSPLVPLYQKAWKHICHRHRLASSRVSPMLLREGTISSELLPNMHLPPLAKHRKPKFPRQAPKTSQILLCVMKSSPVEPPFRWCSFLQTWLSHCPPVPRWLQLSLTPLHLSEDVSIVASLSVTPRPKPAQTGDLSLLWTIWRAHQQCQRHKNTALQRHRGFPHSMKHTCPEVKDKYLLVGGFFAVTFPSHRLSAWSHHPVQSYVTVCNPSLSCPCPHPSEHPFVQNACMIQPEIPKLLYKVGSSLFFLSILLSLMIFFLWLFILWINVYISKSIYLRK